MQSKSLSQTLLNNSKITGVRLNSLSTNLSDTGHGLYIESISQDCYCDLRLFCDKPFWGHTHPLMMQREFKNLSPKTTETNWSILTEGNIEKYQSISYSDISSTKLPEKLIICINESDYLEGISLELLAEINTKHQLIIQEKDLVLSDQKDLFYSHEIKTPKIIDLSFLPEKYLWDPSQSQAHHKDTVLLEAMQRYYHYLLAGKEGKLALDRKVISDFCHQHPELAQFKGNHLMIDRTDLGPNDFLKEGILSNENNFNRGIVLAIPASCTNNELLDTLKRIELVLKR